MHIAQSAVRSLHRVLLCVCVCVVAARTRVTVQTKQTFDMILSKHSRDQPVWLFCYNYNQPCTLHTHNIHHVPSCHISLVSFEFQLHFIQEIYQNTNVLMEVVLMNILRAFIYYYKTLLVFFSFVRSFVRFCFE